MSIEIVTTLGSIVAGCDRLALGRSAATLAILTHFTSENGLNVF